MRKGHRRPVDTGSARTNPAPHLRPRYRVPQSHSGCRNRVPQIHPGCTTRTLQFMLPQRGSSDCAFCAFFSGLAGAGPAHLHHPGRMPFDPGPPLLREFDASTPAPCARSDAPRRCALVILRESQLGRTDRRIPLRTAERCFAPLSMTAWSSPPGYSPPRLTRGEV